MKKFILLFITLNLFTGLFSFDRTISHSYKADYSLFPESKYKKTYTDKLTGNYDIRYCVQTNLVIPKKEANGYTCEQIIKKLDQMGGLDKECFGVSFIDEKSRERKALFKQAVFNQNEGLLYVKDRAAGGLNFDVAIDTYKNNGNIYAINAIINKKPDNIFVRGIKKREAEIFVFMQENDETVSVYALVQCSYSPLEHKIIKNLVETSVTLRVVEIQNWFYRMLTGKK
ncbi:hypothetical protein SAMN04487977_101355 [Treponema bryantii]|uniref:Uncharacterized protein n=1 Tax=Treponema bryantii TaxID=163 RepID=A0A1H9AJ44_9SPIR|nr:hypothetical protein [Treponema bryantii]SEP76615.1 hypothetical protein SAMN04487977_101355 [Treponema bryantii]